MKISIEEWQRAHIALNRFTAWLQAALEGRSLGDDLKQRISRLFWLQAVEDASSIGLLIEKRLVGGARTLIRPQFESLLRGAWVETCAEKTNLESICNYRKQFPLLTDALKAVGKAKSRFRILGDEVPFDELARRGKDAMNDHTHRGTRALARIARANSSSDSIGDDELALLYLAASIGGIAAAAFIEGTGDREATQNVVDEMAKVLSICQGANCP